MVSSSTTAVTAEEGRNLMHILLYIIRRPVSSEKCISCEKMILYHASNSEYTIHLSFRFRKEDDEQLRNLFPHHFVYVPARAFYRHFCSWPQLKNQEDSSIYPCVLRGSFLTELMLRTFRKFRKNLSPKKYTVGLIITTRNFGQCVVNLYEVQKTQCVVIVGWSKILKIRVFLQTKHRVFLKSRNSVFFVAPQIRRAGFVGEVFLANPASFCMERDLWVKFFSQIPLHFAWSRICG